MPGVSPSLQDIGSMMGYSETPSWAPKTNNTYATTPANDAYGLATNTAQSNLAAMPYSQSIAALVNAADQSAQQSANAGRLGAVGQVVQNQLLTNAASEAAGQITPGTVNTIEDTMAQRGGGAGFGVDSANTNAALMRMLGQTSEQLQAQGGTDYSTLLGENPSAPIYSAGTNLVTPGQYSQTAANQGANQGANTGTSGGVPRVSGGGGGGAAPTTATTPAATYGGGYPNAGYTGSTSGLTQAELEQLLPGIDWTQGGQTSTNTSIDPMTGQTIASDPFNEYDWSSVMGGQ